MKNRKKLNIDLKNLTKEQKDVLWLILLGLGILLFVFLMPNIYKLTHRTDIEYGTSVGGNSNNNNSNNSNNNNNDNNNNQNNNNSNNNQNNDNNNGNQNNNNNQNNDNQDNNNPNDNQTNNTNFPKKYICTYKQENGIYDDDTTKTYIIENGLVKEIKTTTVKKYKVADVYNAEKGVTQGTYNDNDLSITTETTNDLATERTTNYGLPENYNELPEYLKNKNMTCNAEY